MAAKISVTVGGQEVIASGCVLAPDNKSIMFQIEDLTFSVVFENTEDKKTAVRATIVADKELLFRFLNFNDSLGHGWRNDIGFIDKRKLHAEFLIHSAGALGNQTHLLSYCFTLGEVVDGQ